MNIASYTTSEYFPIFLTFYDSIKKNQDINLYVLCLDDKVSDHLINNKVKCKPISIYQIENFAKNIKKKNYQNISEKIGVYRLAFIDYLLQEEKKDFHLIDSDTYFFSETKNLENIVTKQDSSVAFCEHNFYYNQSDMNNLYGVYNAGYIYFKYNQNSLLFIKKYRELCENFISWKVIKNKKNIFADQTYLEWLFKEFNFVKIIKNKGTNCAPWNIGNYNLSFTNENYYVDEDKLIFYHFSGIRTLFNKIFFFNLFYYNNKNLKIIKKTLYKEYLKNLQDNQKLISLNKDAKNITYKKILKMCKKFYNNDFLVL